MQYRTEHDSMGEIQVPADRYWGAQTQRSFENFKIGAEKIPMEIIRAFAILKKAAAMANHRLGKLDETRLSLISAVCDEILAGKLDGHFPLAVWQTGSGTQSNMNVNEVIANRGNEIAGKKLLHPNDHSNMSQSSNDTFPTAMHIAAATEIEDSLFPALDLLISTFDRLMKENEGIIKTGRTHLQDATPITFSQEISGWKNMLEKSKAMLELALPGLRELALGGTAVGTGLKHGSSLITCVIADTKKAITPMATSTYAAYCSTSFIFIFRPFFLLFDSVLSAFHSPIKYHSFLITQRRQFFTGFVPDLTVTISSSFPVRLVDVIQIPTLL